MADLLPIVIRFPDGIIDKYNTAFYQGIFDRDLRSDRLVMRVFPQNYNAANPISIEASLGAGQPFDDVTLSLYQLEATDTDKRGAIMRYALQDLLVAGGNLSVYGITQATDSCAQPLIAIEDYHELNEPEDRDRGYALRVGTLQVEALKGNYGSKNNIAVGNSYIISPSTGLTSAAELNNTEWAKYSLLESYDTTKVIDGVWQANTVYVGGEKLGAIAPAGVATINNLGNGCRIIFTHKYNIDTNNTLVPYIQKF